MGQMGKLGKMTRDAEQTRQAREIRERPPRPTRTAASRVPFCSVTVKGKGGQSQKHSQKLYAKQAVMTVSANNFLATHH